MIFFFVNGLKDNDRGVIYFPGKRFIRENTHLYRFIYARFHVLLNAWMVERITAAEKENGRDVEIDTQSASIISEEAWNRTLTHIRAFYRDYMEFKSDGVLLVQATAPWNVGVREHLKTLSDGESLKYVDLYENALSLQPEERRLPYDGHWSVQMHMLSAEYLYEALIHQEEEH